MTEELEKKLNELLGLKKQLEEITADKKKSDTASEFGEKNRKIKVYFYIYLAISSDCYHCNVFFINSVYR
jgi:hypothetical protein